MSDADNTRGIQNAARYPTPGDRHSADLESRLTSEQARLPRNTRSRGRNSFHDNNEAFSAYLGRMNATEVQRIYKNIQDIFRAGEGEVNDSDIKGMLSLKKPPQVDFPYFIFGISVFKDVLDTGDILVVGIVFTTAFSFLCSLILFFWTLGKISGGWWKKAGLSFLWQKMFTTKIWGRLILAMGIEFIPFLKIIPATTIFTFMAYKSETKIVKLINLALEELHRAGIR